MFLIKLLKHEGDLQNNIYIYNTLASLTQWLMHWFWNATPRRGQTHLWRNQRHTYSNNTQHTSKHTSTHTSAVRTHTSTLRGSQTHTYKRDIRKMGGTGLTFPVLQNSQERAVWRDEEVKRREIGESETERGWKNQRKTEREIERERRI